MLKVCSKKLHRKLEKQRRCKRISQYRLYNYSMECNSFTAQPNNDIDKLTSQMQRIIGNKILFKASSKQTNIFTNYKHRRISMERKIY